MAGFFINKIVQLQTFENFDIKILVWSRIQILDPDSATGWIQIRIQQHLDPDPDTKQCLKYAT
jgi:hypothetical protein